MDKCCKEKKSESDVRDTQSAATSAVPSLQDATTSTSGLLVADLQESQKSRDEPKMKPPDFVTFYNLDEFMNILFCETEESERLFTYQAKEMVRRDCVLMQQKEKLNELNILMQSAVMALQNCEGNLLYINYAQSLTEYWLFSLLDLYLRNTTTEFPDDERGLFYYQLLMASLLRAKARIDFDDLTEISTSQNGMDSNPKLQILRILNCHYQMLCAAQLKIETIKKSIEEIQEKYKFFFEKCPYALFCIPAKHS